jgi:hypothetical protein
MKTLHLLLAVFAFLLTSCFFKEPVFTEGFSKVNEALAGVWVAHGEKGDPRKNEFAVCVPIDTERYLLHYPAGEKGGFYYEARPLEIRGRTLLQLRTLATFSDGLPKADAERYTLLWIDPDSNGFSVRALGGEGVKGKGPAATRNLIEDSSGDWSKLFGDPMTFRRLKNE